MVLLKETEYSPVLFCLFSLFLVPFSHHQVPYSLSPTFSSSFSSSSFYVCLFCVFWSFTFFLPFQRKAWQQVICFFSLISWQVEHEYTESFILLCFLCFLLFKGRHFVAFFSPTLSSSTIFIFGAFQLLEALGRLDSRYMN